jgi:DNA-directed RNA polymerase specialized sigma24 family protein
MNESRPGREKSEGLNHWFTTTHWSAVLAAGESDSPQARAALEELARTYWFPVYCFIRHRGCHPEDAQDLTQEFLARFLEQDCCARADPAQGRFRTFLLACLKNFLAGEHRHATTQRRGGGATVIPWDERVAEEGYVAHSSIDLTPEMIYERRWAVSLMERVQGRLRQEYVAAGRGLLFDKLAARVWGDGDGLSYAELSVQLGQSENALRVGVHRLRQQCRELLRAEVAHTVAHPGEVEEELRHLVAVLSG